MPSTDGSDWKEIDYFDKERDQKALVKDFKFKNFTDALTFVNKVGKLAEDAAHHPDINMGWGYVKIWLTTHSVHGITEKDHELAAKIDTI
jgi:4a-hydroxytetrahydrobiopterin dehydratase